MIDDDDLIRQVWTVSARSNNKKMCVFKDVESFLAKTSMIDIQTPIYIDSNLEGGVKGEIEAKRIFDLGFSEIHICTGYAPESFQKVSYIRSIRGKDPPFL